MRVARGATHAHTHTHTLTTHPRMTFHAQHDTISPVAFVSDAWPIIFMLAMAVSNGYFGTLCMTYGPK